MKFQKEMTFVEGLKPAPVASADIWSELEADEDMMVATLVASMESAGEEKETNYKITRITKL